MTTQEQLRLMAASAGAPMIPYRPSRKTAVKPVVVEADYESTRQRVMTKIYGPNWREEVEYQHARRLSAEAQAKRESVERLRSIYSADGITSR